MGLRNPSAAEVTVVAPGAGTGLNGKVYEDLSPGLKDLRREVTKGLSR